MAQPSERVELTVGERTFQTNRTTLQESRYLSNLLSLTPGPYFVDADPALFEHVLRYLRTGMYPISYDAKTGHDHVFYHVLLNEARFFQIEKLQTWLQEQEYLKAVRSRTRHAITTLYGADQIEHFDELVSEPGSSLSVISTEHSQQNCFCCPNGKWRHDGKKAACINALCLTMKQSKYSHTKLMEVVKMEFVTTRVEVDHQRLVRPPQEAVMPPPYHEAS